MSLDIEKLTYAVGATGLSGIIEPERVESAFLASLENETYLVWIEKGIPNERQWIGIKSTIDAVDFMRAGVNYNIDGEHNGNHKFKTTYIEAARCEVLI